MAYTTRELSARTLSDFESLALKQGVCWCMYYQRAKPAERGISTEALKRINRRDKIALVREGRSHAILVYEGRTPVGWWAWGSWWGASSPRLPLGVPGSPSPSLSPIGLAWPC